MSDLAVWLLGPPRIECEGTLIEIGRRKAVALMAYLAMTQRSFHRDELATLLWPASNQSRARGNLRHVLSELNQALELSWLELEGETVGLKQDVAFWLDVEQFRRQLATCQTHGHLIDDVCPTCLPPLTEAVALYRNDFLAGFTLRNSPEFDEWQFFQAENLRQELASALERLVHGHSAQEQFEPAIEHARRWLALDPLHEPVHRHLMQLYAHNGQRAASLRQYQECVQLLEVELDVPASEETTTLYEQIRTRTASQDELPSPAPAFPGSRFPRHNLPAQVTPFVGREAELVEIQDRLQDPTCRLLSLVGPGGSGKTRLALEAGAAQIDTYAQRVFFVSLAPLDSVDSIVPTIAEALGFRFHEEGEPQQQLLDYVRQKRMLLIMDNFEHLVEGAGVITEILQTAAEVKILATSRIRLSVQAEHPFAVAGMRFPDWETDTDATRYSAVRLFLSSVRRFQPKYEASTDDLTAIARICRLVEGMPLAILLAATWMEMLTPTEIAAEVGQSLDFLETDLRDLPERQRSLRAVFDHSWLLLTERERQVFQGLSVFRGDFTREAAQEVTEASLRELMALVNKSLLHHMANRRYEIHELLRQYAAEKLNETPAAREAMRDRHSVYYCTALQQWAVDLKGSRQQTALAEMDVEIENARAAWNWAVERGQVGRLDQAVDGLCRFYEWRGRYQEGEAMCRLTAENLETLASGDGPVLSAVEVLRVWAKILTWQSNFSDRKKANQLLRQSLLLLESPELADQDTRAENAFILRQMGSVAYEYDNDLEKAKHLWEQSLALYQALGDQWGMANTLADLGEAVRSLGIYGKAKQLHEKSLAIRQALGDQEGIADSLDMLSGIARGQGQLEEAERLVRESVVIRSKTGDQKAIANAHLDLGITLVFVGKFAEAHSLMEESLASYSDLRDRDKAWLNGALGYAKVHLGRYKQARAQGQLGLSLAREIGYQYVIGGTLQILGWVALTGEAYAEAQSFLQESVAVRRESGQRYELGVALASLGYAARGLDNIPQAEQHLSEALRTTTDTGIFWPFIYALPAMALLLADQGQKERAVELYALASRHGFVANSRWFEDIVGRHIATVATTLPPEVVAAAQERGKARDREATVMELLAELGGQ